MASGYREKTLQTASRYMVSAAHPLAAEAGLQVLRAGGSAVDAAIAVQMVLTLVEPQASGIGGGAFALHWDGATVQAWDGRETAPAAADERLLLRADGQPMPFGEAAVGGLAVGVPGVLKMLEQVHRLHGRRPWAELFEPAIRLAEQGFAISPRLHALLAAEAALKNEPRAAAYFYRADGTPHPVGHVLRNPALAQVLRQLAAQGTAAFYQGAVAQDMVARVRGHVAAPGRLGLADLAGYDSLERTPLCTDWTERYRDLRHAAAVVGTPGDDADPGHAAVHAAPGPAPGGRHSRCAVAAPVYRGRAAGLRRPCAVRGRPALRARAGR